tara:strand:+ start:156 stop:482 length:327 start_codon:yes stop_codon:yes gene_type:complete
MKQPIEILREDRQYIVPGKSVTWTLNRAKKLCLRANIRSDYTLIPDVDLAKLGNFEQWRISPTDSGALELTCVWDLRLIQDVMFQTVNNIIGQNSYNSTDETLKEKQA